MNNRAYFLYVTTNEINGKRYVGKTWNPAKRWKSHLSSAKSKSNARNSRLYNSIRKYGPAAFSFHVVAMAENEEVCLRAEIALIRALGTSDPNLGYNISKGGDGNSRPCSEETKSKIRLALLGRPGRSQSDEEIARFKARRIHLRRNEDIWRKISAAKMGRPGVHTTPHTEETKKKISEILLARNYRASEETRRLQSESHKGRKLSPETIEKIRKAHIGKKHSPETIARLSAQKKALFAAKRLKAQSAELETSRKLAATVARLPDALTYDKR